MLLTFDFDIHTFVSETGVSILFLSCTERLGRQDSCQYSALLWAGSNQVLVLRGVGIFLFATASKLAVELTHPSIHCVPGVKWLGCEANHLSPSSTKFKNV
jgi:hypothetical protein